MPISPSSSAAGGKVAGIGPGRVLAGLVGRGILESRTPWMHECEGDAQGLRLLYALFDFSDRGWGDERLPELLDAVQQVGQLAMVKVLAGEGPQLRQVKLGRPTDGQVEVLAGLKPGDQIILPNGHVQ